MLKFSSASEAVTALTRTVQDFPQEGILFRDLTPVMADAEAFRLMTRHMSDIGRAVGADLIAGLDARGFVLSAAVAVAMDRGCLAIRKAGKLPPPVLHEDYDLEYGSAALEIPQSGIDLEGARVLIVDDVLATGGTVMAARSLLERAGAEAVGISVVLELTELGGRGRIENLKVDAILGV